jgi:hypothetical protein
VMATPRIRCHDDSDSLRPDAPNVRRVAHRPFLPASAGLE